MVTISYRGKLAELTGCSVEHIQADCVKDVMKHIKKTYGPQALKEARQMLIVVDQMSITLLRNFKTELANGCTVGFLPVCGGG